jgi:hypothetical protein
MGTGGFLPGIKRPECEDDPSPPSSAEVKKAWSYNSTHPIRLNEVVLNYELGMCTWGGALLSTGTLYL